MAILHLRACAVHTGDGSNGHGPVWVSGVLLQKKTRCDLNSTKPIHPILSASKEIKEAQGRKRPAIHVQLQENVKTNIAACVR
jgi:hypothetical protein